MVLPALLGLVLAGTLLLPAQARADRRIFGYTYSYMTLPKGGFEIEHYIDAGFLRLKDPGRGNWTWVNDWKHIVEFEYGITDRWDFGFYNYFRQKPFKNFTYRGPKLRTRYRFSDEGKLFVDPAIYLEIGYFGDEMELEQRIILGKKIGKLEMALNLKFEEEIKFKPGETEVEFVFIPSFGIGYHFNKHLAIGLEYVGQIVVAHGEMEDYVHYLGPTFSVMGKHFFWTLAIQFQLSTDSSKPWYQARSLFGIRL